MQRMIRFSTMLIAIFTLLVPQHAAAFYSTGWGNYSWLTAPTRTYSAPTTTLSAPAQTTASPTSATTASPVAQTLLQLANRERTTRGLTPLQMDSQVTSVATTKSQDMVAKNYFSHTSPTYGSPAQMLTRFGVRYTSYGENIGQGTDAARIHSMWMASTAHRATILNPRFTHVGIGTAGTYTATQLFISR